MFAVASARFYRIRLNSKSMPRAVKSARRSIGRHIVVDPEICHGQPTFKGTRIFVSDVLEQVASGVSWETIQAQWRGDVSMDAIAEAVRLASQALAEVSVNPVAAEHTL